MPYEAKTKPNGESVTEFLEAIDTEARRADAQRLVVLMTQVSGMHPKLWNGGIVGFGTYHYRYDSGHEGESCLIGFSPRKSEFSIYLTGSYPPEVAAERETLLGRLGKHRMGKACLYVKRLDDIDVDVLRQLAELSVTSLRARHAAS